MPYDRSLYPRDWNDIASKVKQTAEWHCVECGRPCRRPGESKNDLVQRLKGTKWFPDLFENGRRCYQRFTLTVSHTNHRPEDCSDGNLRALCAPCHCRYDKQPESIAILRQLKAERTGQLKLVEGSQYVEKLPPGVYQSFQQEAINDILKEKIEQICSPKELYDSLHSALPGLNDTD